MRELNRRGLTSAIDAGGGLQNYPDDYKVIEKLEAEGQLTIRIAYNLFTQKPKGELDDFKKWTSTSKYGSGSDFLRHNGAGEMLVFSAADFEDFLEPRPELPDSMEKELEDVVRILVSNRWPFRLHATYDESISRMLDVFESVNREIPFDGLPWFFDHAETINQRKQDMLSAMTVGTDIQDGMAFHDVYLVQRERGDATKQPTHIRRMLCARLPVVDGTDATRVSRFNHWYTLYWLVSTKTVDGLPLYSEGLSRELALELYTHGSAWFSSEQGKKGMIKEGQFADFIALSADYFTIDEEKIKQIESVLTVVNGKVVYATEEFGKLAPSELSVMPDWSPVRKFPGHFNPRGYATGIAGKEQAVTAHHCCGACSVHGHNHDVARKADIPTDDYRDFWGAFGCSCFVF